MDAGYPANRMSRRFFLRASSATLLAAPLFRLVPVTGVSWRFFTGPEAETVNAICERIIPSDQDPGASWAGVVQFIDRKLTGYHRGHQKLYRTGLRGVHESCLALFGKPFVDLPENLQDQLLEKLESNQAAGDAWKQVSPREFFNRLVEHTMQGFYGGPRHGGNRDATSWRMLGLPTPPLHSRRPLTAPWNTTPAPSPDKP
jgi:gluconate 2-dehydrogenase gamma chain